MQAVENLFHTLGALVVDLVAQVATTLGLPAFIVTLVALLLPAAFVVAFFPGFFAFLTWLERKILARIQNRYGPNRVGPMGILQPIADGVKMLSKEDIVPRAADPLLHGLGPILVVVPAIVVYALLPFGEDMTPADLDVSLLLFFAISSFSTLALFFAGWGSRNKYSLLGALRAIAQMVSYELPLVLAAVPVVMMTGTMRVSAIVAAQGPPSSSGLITGAAGEVLAPIAHWFVFTPWGFAGFLLFLVAGMAELNRSPFDLAEGESEIVAGFHTEYSGMKFALFFLAEYLAAIAFAGLCAALFLGGFHGPSFIPSWLVFFTKMFAILLFMIWVRGTLPRLRVDQLMGFSWKLLLPLCLVNVLATGLYFHLDGASFAERATAWGVALVVLVPSYLVLARVNAGPVVKKRTYKYAAL